MHWGRFLFAVAASGVVASFTDWLFMGALFHAKYLETPEVWRNKPGQSETQRIVASSLMGLVSCAAFIVLCRWTEAVDVRRELILAGVAWIAGPVPIVFSNIVWIKMHPLLGVSHSLGWLARFVVSGLMGGWLLG
jgi:hypothetical protein